MLKVDCSNCGKHLTIKLAPTLAYAVGYRAVGDAFYCIECAQTWSERNGNVFDSQYGIKNGQRMVKEFMERRARRK